MLNTQLKTLTCAMITSCLITACGGGSSSTSSTNVTPTTPTTNTNQPTQPTTPTNTNQPVAPTTPATPPATNTNQTTNTNQPTQPSTPPTNTNQPTNPTTPITPPTNTNQPNNSTTNLLGNIKLSASNTFELYDFEYQITDNEEPNDFYVDALIKVKDGKVEKSTETTVLGNFHTKNLGTFLADNFSAFMYMPIDIPKSNFKEYILGLDKSYAVMRDNRTNEPVLFTTHYKEVDLSGKDVSDLFIVNPLSQLDLDDIYFPNGSKCWGEHAVSSTKSGYLVTLDQPEPYRSVSEWKENYKKFHTFIDEKQDKVGADNAYSATRLTVNNKLLKEVSTIGLVSVNSKFYEGPYITNQPPKESKAGFVECTFMNKTARDFVVKQIKSHYNIK